MLYYLVGENMYAEVLIEDSEVDAIYPSLLSINEFQKLSGIDFKEEL